MEKTPLFAWLKENAHKHGFTPYKWEPWHWEVRVPYNAWASGREFTDDYAVRTTKIGSKDLQIGEAAAPMIVLPKSASPPGSPPGRDDPCVKKVGRYSPPTSSEPSAPWKKGQPVSEIERDALARLIWAETSMHGPQEEHAGIIMIALNRAGHPRYSILDVATPPGRSSEGVWNNGRVFRERWQNAPNHKSFARARALVDGLVDGKILNPIGDARKLFVHPTGLNRCSGATYSGNKGKRAKHNGKPIGNRRRCVGGRALPAWSVAKTDGGTAPRDPITVGRGLFS